MKYVIIALLTILQLTSNTAYSHEEKNKIKRNKFNDVAFVIYCEDRTNTKAMKMVLSTIYNRAKSYDINKLHKEVSKRNQYYCYNLINNGKKIETKKMNQVRKLLHNFIMYKGKPITNAVFFYNHKQVRPKFARRLKIIEVYGAHTYLTNERKKGS